MITQDNFLKKSLKDSNIKSLGELITFNSTKNKDNSNITILSVNNTKGIIPQEEQFLDRRVASKNTSNYKIVKKGDFVFNPSRINVGSIGQLLDFEIGIVSPLYTCFSCNTELLSKFFKYYTQSNTFKNQIKSKLEGSVRNSLSEKGLAEVLIKLPSMYYQQKIADFLSTVDDKIENQKEIVANWEEIKKGLIQKIFSQEMRFQDENGQDYPEWKNEMLGKLCVAEQKSKYLASYGKNDGLYPFISSNTSNEMKYADTYILNSESIIVNGGGEAYFRYINGKFAYSTQCIVLTTNENTRYIYYYLDANKKIINQKGFVGGGLKYIDRNYLKSFIVKIPSPEEQQKIADFLSAIDKKIENQKEIVANWEEIKKGLIQRIFKEEELL